jgi:2-(1,2-epoxy-1,2-dihydrophenyl)acetyl-CoA isomerase
MADAWVGVVRPQAQDGDDVGAGLPQIVGDQGDLAKPHCVPPVRERAYSIPRRARQRRNEETLMTTIDAGTEDLLAELDGGVLTLTLNRPAARNAMSGAMNAALGRQLAWAETASDVRVVVLTGAGQGFCAGGDVKGMASRNDGGAPEPIDAAIHRQRLDQRATAGKLFSMPKPTIAALPGAAAGAGLSLALACDLRVMARTAIMTTAFARVGFSGDYGGTYFLTQLVGSARARELYYLSERVTADEALRLGLTNWVVEPDELAARTRAIAARLAAGPTIAFRYMKENLNRAMAGELGDCLDLEATHHVHCGQTADHREAAAAFVAKREPVFTGR